MRRDVYIENDSGGFSVVAGDAVDAIIADQRANDYAFVTGFKALLLELYGDDSMPVRLVVDEPLRPDEDAQWLAKASWRIDTTDGRVLVMGGFDPDIMSWWKEETGGDADGRGVAVAAAAPGSLRVDVYAHVGSMNGRHILSEADLKPGAAFRRSHAGRPFPLWLAHMLEFSGDDDPGHEDLWRDLKASTGEGRLAVDVDGAAPIGFLVHIQRLSDDVGDPPEGGWFPLDSNRRVPEVFPVGIASSAADTGIESFRDQLLGRERQPEPAPIATQMAEIIEVWSGDPARPIGGAAPPITLDLSEIYYLHWIASLSSDSPPHFEYWIHPASPWQAPDATAEYATGQKSGGIVAVASGVNNGGWWLMWGSRNAAAQLSQVPEGSTLDVGMMVIPGDPDDEDFKPDVGRACYSGSVRQGQLQLAESSPAVDRQVLADAIQFVRDMVRDRHITVRSDAEREALMTAAQFAANEEGALTWNGETVRVNDEDDRTLIMLASPVFRLRFGRAWPCDDVEEW